MLNKEVRLIMNTSKKRPDPDKVVETLLHKGSRMGLELIEDTETGIFVFSSKDGVCIEKVDRDHYVVRLSKSRGHIWDPKRYGYGVRLGEGLNIEIVPEDTSLYKEKGSGDS